MSRALSNAGRIQTSGSCGSLVVSVHPLQLNIAYCLFEPSVTVLVRSNPYANHKRDDNMLPSEVAPHAF